VDARDDPIRERFLTMDFPEGFRAEYIGGEIIMMSSASALHNRIMTLIQAQAPDGMWAQPTQGVALEPLPDLPEPDVVFVEEGAVTGNPSYIPAAAVALVVEVVSPSNWRRDLHEKPALYAKGGVAAYLIVDPRVGTLTLLTRPYGGAYQDSSARRFGEPVPLPIGAVLDTSRFPTYPAED
jgi:Uma2 family endonuclease